jgi:hypothetical protein
MAESARPIVRRYRVAKGQSLRKGDFVAFDEFGHVFKVQPSDMQAIALERGTQGNEIVVLHLYQPKDGS